MAPLNPIKEDKRNKSVHDILELAQRISSLLRDRDPIPSGIPERLDSYIKHAFPLQNSAVLTQKASELESLGCELWNGAINALRQNDKTQDSRIKHNDRMPQLMRVFAFFLIDAAHQTAPRRSKKREQFMRNFKLALKACRFCLNNAELDLGQKLLERCSDYALASQDDSQLVRISGGRENDEHRATLSTLVSELYLLRVLHAWKSDRVDLAEHHFNKISMGEFSDSTKFTENAADLFYEMGKSLYRKKNGDSAIVWLRRALVALDARESHYQSEDAGDLRLAVTSTLARCVLQTGDEDSIKRAHELTDELCLAHGLGNRVTLQLLQVDILLAERPIRSTKLSEIISRILHSTVLTNHTFKAILQAIHRAHRESPNLACEALAELITGRLLADLPDEVRTENSTSEYLEQACVTLVYYTSSNVGSLSLPAVNMLQQTFDTILQQSNQSLSLKATHAAQALIWKAAGIAGPETSDRWHSLLKHPLFNGAGHSNKARIGRKAMRMATEKGNFEAAREVFFQLAPPVQNEGLTRYLAFQLAVQTNDYDLAHESLDLISKQASKDQTLLYACVLAAQQSEMRPVAVAALQAILDKKPSTSHLPSLLRCTARLLITELDTNSRSQDETMEQVVYVFENAADNLQVLKTVRDDQWRAEVQWWSKNAYNLSLQHCEDMHSEHLIRLLSVCSKFIDSCPNDEGIVHQVGLTKRKAMCHFLSANALIVLGRTADKGSEYSLQSYLHARQEIDAFKAVQLDSTGEDASNVTRKLFELLKFDLECVLKLQYWDQFDASLQACLNFKDVERWDTLADIVLIIRKEIGATKLDDKSNARMNELLERIINDTWQKDKNMTKAARWLRLSFTIDLDDGKGEFALKLLKQATNMAKKAYNKASGTYPETELQWLAITSFNKAIDLLSSGTVEDSEEWMVSALDLARYGADNGALHANLTDKREQVLQRRREIEA